jgi:hypothetical protein
MKQYCEIPGPSKAPQEPCIAFSKLDGSNLRFEYSRKQGWHKFGTRHLMFNETDDLYGCAIKIFLDTYGDAIPKVLHDNKNYRGVQNVIAYCEFFGPNSMAGWHQKDDPKELVLFDLWVYKKGFVLPRDFVNDFGHIKIPPVVYEGNFNKQFVMDVKEGLYPVDEGVVAKGVIKGFKNSPNGIWMSKVKSKLWIEKLRKCYKESQEFRKALEDNIREQEFSG